MTKRFRLSEILENIPIPVFVIDNKHRVKYWNKACEELTGYTKDEIIGTSDHWKPFFSKRKPLLADMVLDGVEDVHQKNIRKVDGSGDTYELEIYIPNLKKWLYLRASTLKSDGEVIGAVEIIQDITERKKMEEEIRNLSEFYKLIGEAVNQSESIEEIASKLLVNLRRIIDFDIGGILVYNSKTKTLESVKRVGFEDILEINRILADKYVVEENNDSIAVVTALRGEPIYISNMKESVYTKHFHDICVEYDLEEMYSVPLISKGELQGVIQLIVKSDKKLAEKDRRFIDTISEQMAAAIAKIRAEEKVRESERKYRELFEFSMDAILLTDMNGNILEANNAVEKLFGYTKDELKRINFNELYVDPEDSEKLLRELEENGSFKNCEVRYRRKDGLIVYCLESAVLLRDENGKVVGCHRVIKDITERKRIEERLRRVNKLLRVASEINQLTVQEKDEISLLKRACKTLASIEDYAAVWVGLLNENKIIPIQVVGEISEDELKSYLEDPSGLQCVREVIETRTPSLVSPREDRCWKCPIHEEGRFVQTLVLPIAHDRRLYGVITFHSLIPDVFDGEEMNILLDLVDDIGFAIRTIEIERERREALNQIKENLEVFESLADKLRNPIAIIKGFMEVKEDVGVDKTLKVISKEIGRIQEILDELREKEKKTYKLGEKSTERSN